MPWRPAGLRAHWLGSTSTCWRFSGGRWRRGGQNPHGSAWLPRLLPQRKPDWECFRAVRARKTNPGSPDREHGKAAFMSHPETTCSSSHLWACSSVGGAARLCSGARAPPAAVGAGRGGGHSLASPPPSSQAQPGCRGTWRLPGVSGGTSASQSEITWEAAVGGLGHPCSAALGTSPNLSTGPENAQGHLASEWQMRTRTEPWTPRALSLPAAPGWAHPGCPPRGGGGCSEDREGASPAASPPPPNQRPLLPPETAAPSGSIFMPPQPCQITASRPALWRYFLGFATHAVTNTCYILKTSPGKNLSCSVNT